MLWTCLHFPDLPLGTVGTQTGSPSPQPSTPQSTPAAPPSPNGTQLTNTSTSQVGGNR